MKSYEHLGLPFLCFCVKFPLVSRTSITSWGSTVKLLQQYYVNPTDKRTYHTLYTDIHFRECVGSNIDKQSLQLDVRKLALPSPLCHVPSLVSSISSWTSCSFSSSCYYHSLFIILEVLVDCVPIVIVDCVPIFIYFNRREQPTF